MSLTIKQKISRNISNIPGWRSNQKIVSIRIAFDSMGFFSVFGNPLLTMFFNVDITLIELVKGIVL